MESASNTKRARNTQKVMAAAVRTVVSPSVTSTRVALARAAPCAWLSSRPDAHSRPHSSATPRRVWWCGEPTELRSTAIASTEGAAETSAPAASTLGLAIGALATQ
eukprot:scaffold1519_cov99-Isochrysis_galbana.AAC.6